MCGKISIFIQSPLAGSCAARERWRDRNLCSTAIGSLATVIFGCRSVPQESAHAELKGRRCPNEVSRTRDNQHHASRVRGDAKRGVIIRVELKPLHACLGACNNRLDEKTLG